MSDEQRSIIIGPEYFAKAPKDYRDPLWAWVREIVQNCLDAPGTTRVNVSITSADGSTTVVVENDGEPMSEDILTGKLLALGSSGKGNAPDAIGGFGKAKEILYFCQRGYTIETGALAVDGCGGQYTLTRPTTPVVGTRSTVVHNGDIAAEIEGKFRKLIGMSQRNEVRFAVNGETIPSGLGRGPRKRVFKWGATYTNDAIANQVVVRVAGMPMFSSHTSCPQGVIVELTGKSTDLLTANRDGLQYPYCQELESFITQLAIDSGSALRVAEPEYNHVRGSKLNNDRCCDDDDEQNTPKLTATLQEIAALIMQGQAVAAEMGIDLATIPEPPPSQVSFDFVVKNTTGRKLPAGYDPASDRFTKAALRLTKCWVGCLLELHRLDRNLGRFSVGFIFDIERAAEHEKGRYGRVYYINPCTPGDATFKQTLTFKDKSRIIAYAAHEYVHGLGYGFHGEDYAAHLTRITEVVIENLHEFNKCFKA